MPGKSGKRLALIIVVPEYRTETGLDLPVVRNDAEALRRSLKQSGYDTRVVGTEMRFEATNSIIRTEVRNACQAAPAAGTLLIFFSGHGLQLNMKDYLLPADADLSDPQPERVLFDIGDLVVQTGDSKAALIVVFVDACRKGDELVHVKSGVLHKLGGRRESYAAQPKVAFIFGCQPAEYAHYVPGEDGFSIFSRALAETLAANHPARTLQEVLDAAQILAMHLAEKNNREPQRFARLFDQASRLEKAVICEGHAQPDPLRGPLSWEVELLRSTLWERCGASGQGDQAERVQACRAWAAGVAADAHATHHAAAQALGPDPWRDEHYPVRVLQQLDALIVDAELLDLTPVEVALLAAAPFLREHAYACGVRAFAAARPLVVELDPATLAPVAAERRRRLQATYRAYPQALRRVASLQGQHARPHAAAADMTDPAPRAVLLWLLHRQLARFAPLWQAPPHGTLDDAAGHAAPAPQPSTDDAQLAAELEQALSRQRLLKLAKCVHCESDRLRSYAHDAEADLGHDELPHALEVVLPGFGGAPIREQLLGALLCLAGWLALDIRLADAVLVDHIGIADPVPLDGLAGAVSAARWVPVGRVWKLAVQCEHPAIDYALRQLVTDANRVLGEVMQLLAASPSAPALIGGLPGQLLPDGIVPAQSEGRPAYRTPHWQFTLAHDEVRELLMGEQLYGDPDLALRELYQNALDACRYRRARLQFLARRGEPSAWRGRIVMRQGVEAGRAYVECEDNGIGMGLRELESCFARAGKRFADLPEFIEEQERWQQCDPQIEIWPNSQFGIGVLSYFMIADEIELRTCRLRRDGNPGVDIAVTIPGSGSLFRVRPGARGADAGTRLRLYLREDWNKSCCDVLGKLLVVAEFETEVGDGTRRLNWPAGQPRDAARYQRTGNPDFWWDKEINGGAALADGLAVELKTYPNHPPGALVNFSGRHKPRLTVDRKQVLECDKEWLERTSVEQAAYLAGMPWLRLSLLWNLPEAAQAQLEKRLVAEDAMLPIGYFKEFSSSLSYQFDDDILAQRLEDAGGRTIGYPVRIVGLDKDDAFALRFLLDAALADDPHAQLQCLNSLLRTVHIDVPERDDPARREKTEAILASLHQQQRFNDDPQRVRAAIYAALGFPAPAWVHAYLPEGDIAAEASAKVLARALEPPPVPPGEEAPKPPHLGRRLLNAVGRALDRLPQWAAGTIVVTVIGIAGHLVIVSLQWLWQRAFG